MPEQKRMLMAITVSADFIVAKVTATADATYQGDSNLQAGFELYEKEMTFTATSRTYYWCADGATQSALSATPYDESKDTLAPVAINVSLPAEWNGQETIVGYVAIAAHGSNISADDANVTAGFTTILVS